VGTGTAQIPIEICRRRPRWQIVAVDLADEMLKLASRNVAVAKCGDFIQLQRADAKDLPFVSGEFDAVISNSIVHHIPVPKLAIDEMVRVVRPGGLLFVRDLLRPADATEVERIVEMYAGGENAHQQQMFRDSLHAALTLEEIRDLLEAFGLSPESAAQTSDRHWTIVARR
jgi:ubiquinone/menaquinone biosynthesis C-methylase UbiE